ncbi:hypothetical protein PoB_001927000 [Plakobranchus ocellatus]|uniref:Uncharacterized protein n=1 Tax=Plakobranchus ocellatus TaxID=259542 RepID=A0AAV3ZB59_9GAST|nr:hypothetical protein PoB_001927000 [Plakobranchus ocellatus]
MADMGCGLIVVLGVLLASFHAQGSPKLTNDPNTAVCEHWSDVARQMTGSGRSQTCVNNKTDSCTRLDCNGTVVYPVRATAYLFIIIVMC